MGQNSTDVTYNFGQMGCAHGKIATPIIPPKGKVIVAIQFLATNIPTVLESEQLKEGGAQFINTVNGANFEGVTTSQDAQGAGTSTTASNYSTTDIVITANPKVKVGQYVLLVDDENTDVVGMGTAATSAGDGVDPTTLTPIYHGANSQGTYVTEVNAAGTEIKLSNFITFDGSQHMVFLDENHGAGGQQADGIAYPKGMVIYGRWTKIIPAADPDGGVICYFGY
jgi:hypothetical protein